MFNADLFSLLAVGLATWQAVEVYHHAAITLPIRQYLATVVPTNGVSHFFLSMLRCPFCLSHWVAGLFTGVWFFTPHPVDHWIVFALAATRLANIGNDLFYAYDRSPKYEIEGVADDTILEQGDRAAG